MSKLRTMMLEPLLGWLEGSGDPLLREFADPIGRDAAERPLSPRTLEATRWLGRAAELSPPPERALASALASLAPELCWGQTYSQADFGADFLDNYCWVEIVGTRGHFVSAETAAGFLLLGPGVDYPDHHHIAEELYIPLTGGALWSRGGAGFAPRAAGEIIHHPSNMAHAMRTGDEPLLAFYLWRGGPLDQKSTIGRSTG